MPAELIGSATYRGHAVDIHLTAGEGKAPEQEFEEMRANQTYDFGDTGVSLVVTVVENLAGGANTVVTSRPFEVAGTVVDERIYLQGGIATKTIPLNNKIRGITFKGTFTETR